MLHRFLLVSSDNSGKPVENAKPTVSILPPGDGKWVQIGAGKIEELGDGWYRAELGDRSGDERLIVTASASGALVWRDIVDLNAASLAAAAASVQAAADAATEAANAAKAAQEAASAAQTDANKALENATTTANEALALLGKIKAEKEDTDPEDSQNENEIVTKSPAAWLFHDRGDAFTRKNVGDGVEVICRRASDQAAQLYDKNYALKTGRYRLLIEADGTPGARFRFEVLHHGEPYHGLGKSPIMEIGGENEYVLELRDHHNARLRLWFSDLAKAGDRYVITKISLVKES